MGSDMTPIIPGPPSGARSPGNSPHASGLGVEEYQWLVSPEAERWLEIAAGADEKSLVRMSLTLRKDLGVTRTHLVIAQAELRRRAGTKFKHASRMFFTRQLLEQSTDDQIAGYKAQRWPADGRLADLCCGIGGDLLALAQRGPVVGVDRDPVAVVLSTANCRLAGLTGADVQLADACEKDVAEFVAWHADPDRRIEGQRRTRVECHEPDLDALERLLAKKPSGGSETRPGGRTPGTLAGSRRTGVDRESRRVPAANGLVPRSRSRSGPAFGDGLRGGGDRAQDHPWRSPAGDSHRRGAGTLCLRAPCRRLGGRLDRRAGRSARAAMRVSGNRLPDGRSDPERSGPVVLRGDRGPAVGSEAFARGDSGTGDWQPGSQETGRENRSRGSPQANPPCAATIRRP